MANRKASPEYQKKRNDLIQSKLGTTNQSARNILRKLIIWNFIVKYDENRCFVCDLPMTLDTFTVEHKKAWLNAENPKETFFDVNNISFNHSKCNTNTKGQKTHCKQGHEYTPENTRRVARGLKAWRQCRTCAKIGKDKFLAKQSPF